MPYAVLLRLDAAGACPVILRDDSEPLTGGEGVRYRFVAETDDQVEAVQVADLLQRRMTAGEV
jgi:hypothetical protein